MSTTITPFAPASLEQAESLADKIAKSSLLPAALRNKPGDVLVILITGHELGLSPMQALRGMHVIEGKAAMSADLMVALAQKDRATCEYFRMVESTDQKAVYETKRAGHPSPVRMEFTLDQAKAAGLTGRDNWRKYPAAMLRARCASALARAVYPDLFMGVYDPDELHAAPVAPVAATPSQPARNQVVEAEVVISEQHDPATGEVKASPAELLAAEIESASDDDALRSVAEKARTIKSSLSADEYRSLLAAYESRKAAVSGSAR